MTTTTGLSQAAARAAARALIDNADALCALDSVAGDGDHGLAMAAAARGILARLDAAPELDGADLLDAVASEFSSVGGSMGALLFVAADSAAAILRSPQAPDGPALVAAMLAAAQEQISDLGGAVPGDKTLLDALDPARAAATDAAGSASVVDCLRSAADAARAGAEGTAQLTARIGRASRLGDISLGSPDAGATSFALVLDAVASTYEKESA